MGYIRLIGTGVKLTADVETLVDVETLYLYYTLYIFWIKIATRTKIITV